MAKQTFTTGSVLTAAQMNNLQANDYNWTVSQKSASYVLAAADAGTRIEMNAAGATTVTVNTGLFTAGDSVIIQNIGAGTCTITAGTATVNKATNASLALAQYQGGTLYFVSASSAIFFPFDVGTGASAFVGCSLFKSANQSLNNNSVTQITFDSENFDTNGFHDNVTNNQRITIPSGQDGKYLLTGCVYWESLGGSGYRYIRFTKNSTILAQTANGESNGGVVGTNLAYVVDLVAGDYVFMSGLQTYGTALNALGTAGYTFFQAIKVG